VREHLRITFGGRPSFEVTRIEHLTVVLDGEEGGEGARFASGATSVGRPSPNRSRRVVLRARVSTT
jgi:hypothetical protein